MTNTQCNAEVISITTFSYLQGISNYVNTIIGFVVCPHESRLSYH